MLELRGALGAPGAPGATGAAAATGELMPSELYHQGVLRMTIKVISGNSPATSLYKPCVF